MKLLLSRLIGKYRLTTQQMHNCGFHLPQLESTYFTHGDQLIHECLACKIGCIKSSEELCQIWEKKKPWWRAFVRHLQPDAAVFCFALCFEGAVPLSVQTEISTSFRRIPMKQCALIYGSERLWWPPEFYHNATMIMKFLILSEMITGLVM